MTKKELKQLLRREARAMEYSLKTRFYRAQYEKKLIKLTKQQVEDDIVHSFSYYGSVISKQTIAQTKTIEDIRFMVNANEEARHYNRRSQCMNVAKNNVTGKFVKYLRVVPEQIQLQINNEINKRLKAMNIDETETHNALDKVKYVLENNFKVRYYREGLGPYLWINVISDCDKYNCEHETIQFHEWKTLCVGYYKDRRVLDFYKIALAIVTAEYKAKNSIHTGKQDTTRQRDKAQRINQYEYQSKEWWLIERMKKIKVEHDQMLSEVAIDLLEDDEKIPTITSSLKSELIYKLTKALNRVKTATLQKKEVLNG